MRNNQSITNPKLEPWTFIVSLAITAHSLAEKFLHYHSSPQLGKQVYINTLAVYAVNIYLQYRGFETDWENSDSWNPVMQKLMNVADLIVQNHGKLECRPVLPEAEVVSVPPEVWSERIGYVAVQLDESLRQATVLGFVDKVSKSEIPISELRSLGELPEYLNKIRPAITLSQWFENVFEKGWEALETILTTEPTEAVFNFRSCPQAEVQEVKRCKLIELGNSERLVAMIITLTSELEEVIHIVVQVQPPDTQTYLPDNLQVLLLNEDEEAIMDIHSGRENKTIQLEFTGELGDHFSIKIVLDNTSIIENFVI
ncbi:DUF1822 family protein [Aetokthonos hydrillicola Thurmond2011]|jgi:hypothetical protein|uniref:DUF1822 family protein n=1 Tax=Aetokthonos hydrillicola Thurmond2011 TaxID=2712845 RepID=A0AAP5MCM7_9CYAN|nr:DUF1822 family protein [Aetokthonos hydrillicola]MBO3459592.1 DUF1822 family protein [Aetokthonos hydrillicola CCALA 1050]MBW4590958.1 DUF1822 family protein [Aetokthonos hydrillicola CCALA 1050]MDR9899372.1 DUF1822 family protein [Aetokthonos hydrillicola Thurmond2011]